MINGVKKIVHSQLKAIRMKRMRDNIVNAHHDMQEYDANKVFDARKYGFNMTALRSRPMRKHSWQYYFYVEIDGTTDTENGKNMIEELKQVCDKLKIAGTFAPHTEI